MTATITSILFAPIWFGNDSPLKKKGCNPIFLTSCNGSLLAVVTKKGCRNQNGFCATKRVFVYLCRRRVRLRVRTIRLNRISLGNRDLCCRRKKKKKRVNDFLFFSQPQCFMQRSRKGSCRPLLSYDADSNATVVFACSTNALVVVPACVRIIPYLFLF